MFSTFASLTVPSLQVIGVALAGLIVCLIAMQAIDNFKSSYRLLRRYVLVFTWPLLAFFAVFFIIKLIEITA
jgi:hypothetical protein